MKTQKQKLNIIRWNIAGSLGVIRRRCNLLLNKHSRYLVPKEKQILEFFVRDIDYIKKNRKAFNQEIKHQLGLE